MHRFAISVLKVAAWLVLVVGGGYGVVRTLFGLTYNDPTLSGSLERQTYLSGKIAFIAEGVTSLVIALIIWSLLITIAYIAAHVRSQQP